MMPWLKMPWKPAWTNLAGSLPMAADIPGTELDKCSPQFLEYFKAADLVIAKGQGNFESLSEVDRDIFFLLTIKCAVAAQHMTELAGVEPEKLPGKGEMAVYYSGQNNKK